MQQETYKGGMAVTNAACVKQIPRVGTMAPISPVKRRMQYESAETNQEKEKLIQDGWRKTRLENRAVAIMATWPMAAKSWKPTKV